MPLDARTFRDCMAAFPTGVAVVTTLDADGAPKGFTSQSLTSVSTDPPIMLVSVDKTSRTLAPLRRHGAFALNYLAAGRERIAETFASKSNDKFEGLRWQPSVAAKGAPLLTEHSVACAECLVMREIEAGDHVLILASVEDGRVLPGVPLLYYRRTYGSWPEAGSR